MMQYWPRSTRTMGVLDCVTRISIITGLTSCTTSPVQSIGCAATSKRSRRDWTGKDSADGKAVLALMLMRRLLLLDILTNDANRTTTAGCGEVGRRPENIFSVPALHIGPLGAQTLAGHAFETIDQGRDKSFGWIFDQEMHMAIFSIHFRQARLEVGADLRAHFARACCHKNRMDMHLKAPASTSKNVVVITHRSKYNRSMKHLQAFKFELHPNGEQQRLMRRFSGSCRFVFNKVVAMQ